ncbi:MAG TPA: DUF1835 domain-containing protein [Vicinamibacterales bacterium]
MPALHITNGDCAASTLREFLTDPVVVSADVLHEGPAPDVDDAAWYALRARFLSSGDDDSYRRIRASLEASDRAITEASADAELVLWFEHDLFDQLLLIRLLDRIGRTRPNRGLSLIGVDRFPGVERFIGLGQLTAGQLSTLVDVRQRVTDDQLTVARDAWRAFRLPNPGELSRLSAADGATDALPFLGAALRRFLGEYPSTDDGLSTTRHAALENIATGPLTAAELFARTQRREESPFMGDTVFFALVQRLAGGRSPLVEVQASANGNGHRQPSQHSLVETDVVRLTAAGRDVLERRADAIGLNGIDEWRGGVHLAGQDGTHWRWDRTRRTLVSWSGTSHQT